jgi:hypothetical protein
LRHALTLVSLLNPTYLNFLNKKKYINKKTRGKIIKLIS